MRVALLVAGGALVVAATLGWVVRRWLPETASWIGMSVTIAARVLGGVAVGWSVARAVRHSIDAVHLALVSLVSGVGLWVLVSAVAMLDVAAFRRDLITEAEGRRRSLGWQRCLAAGRYFRVYRCSDEGREWTGYDVLTFIEREVATGLISFPIPMIMIHPADSVGRQRMEQAIAIYPALQPACSR